MRMPSLTFRFARALARSRAHLSPLRLVLLCTAPLAAGVMLGACATGADPGDDNNLAVDAAHDTSATQEAGDALQQDSASPDGGGDAQGDSNPGEDALPDNNAPETSEDRRYRFGARRARGIVG